MIRNLDMDVAGDILTVKIDLSKRLGLSQSEKSNIIASTGGPVHLVEGVTLNIACYAKERPALFPGKVTGSEAPQ